MTRVISVLLGLGLVASLGVAIGFPRSFEEHAAVMDSLREMPRWEQVRWLARRGLPDPYLRDCTPVEDSGLSCVGRWSYGPCTWVDIRATPTDTTVFLSRGSGVSIIRFRCQDSLRLDLLADINSRSLTGRCQVRDSLLYVNSGGVECYDIHDLANPILLNWLSQPLIYDFFVVDTLLYTSSEDSLRIFSVANPASPRRLGACADSGYVMYVSGNYAYLGHQAGLFIVDVSNPVSPHRVRSLGYDVLSISVKDSLLFFGTTEFALHVYNVRDPATPFPVGSLSGIEAHDLYVSPTCDTVLYTPKLHVISISDPRNPRQIGFVNCPGWDYGVRAVPALNCALVADYFDGLVAVDIKNPDAPLVDTSVFAAGSSEDICIDNGKAYVAQYYCGMRILDISDPARPQLLGAYDTVGQTPPTSAIVARDSFAYFGWTWPPYLHSFSVTNPAKPVMHGGADITNPPEDMVFRDSFVYVAEANRFQIVNVARPREPALVGSCVLPGVPSDLCIADTVAYASRYIVSIARPDSPVMLGPIPGSPGGAIAARDSFAFAPAQYDSLVIVNAARPSAAFRVASLVLSGGHIWNAGAVLVGDTMLFIGGDLMHVVNVADPLDPREIATWRPPRWIRRVTFNAPYVYAACYEAGVCVLETVVAGLAETPLGKPPTGCLAVAPNPTSTSVLVRWGPAEPGFRRWRLCDAAGRVRQNGKGGNDGNDLEVDLTLLETGVYFLEVQSGSSFASAKVVKR